MEENKKMNKVLVIAVIILSILVIALGGYICYDKVISNNNDEQTECNKNNKVEEKDDNTNNDDDHTNDNSANLDLDFDFNELSSTLHASVQKDNITTLISKCVEKTTSENDLPETELNNTEVSNNTIDTIIDKLKTAKSIEKDITYSWFGCPPKSITYYVSVNSNDRSQVHGQSVFSLNYADGEDILLVGYNNNGYAFYFNSSEEISGFIESLK